MATVFLAEDVKNRRDVAVKVLRPELSASVGADRFLREIEIAGQLSHPNILPLHDSGEADGLLYYVMPHVDGESLRARLEREKQLPLDDALETTRQVARALDFAHSRGIVHRDIKPENILFWTGQAVVADFGIARAVTEAGGEKLTQTGMAVGTPSYMSPEQAGGGSVDGRSDVYSLGCVLYEMLAGSAPFAGPTAQAIMARHALDPAPRIRTVRDTVPVAVEQAVLKALAKVPADRFATAGQFVQALDGSAPILPSEPDADAIAVLEFANLSHDTSLDWLCAGIAETVTHDLKKTGSVSVIGRDRMNRVLKELGGDLGETDIVELGRSVGARWVVSGGFQTIGGLIRITPRFVETATGEVVSAAKIDGPMDDLFALQDKIVVALMDVLEVELSPAAVADIEQPQTEQVEAYELYARGRQLIKDFGAARFAEAREYFEQAVALDPEYALAHAGLGHIGVFTYIRTTDPADLESGVADLQRALELDDSLGEALVWLTYGYIRQDRYTEAEATGRRATELEPDYGMSHYMLAVARLCRAMTDRRWAGIGMAVQSLLTTVAVDPDIQPAHMVLAWAYMLNGEYDRAEGFIHRAVEIEVAGAASEHRFVGAYTLKALFDFRCNRLEVARAGYEHAVKELAEAEHMYRDAFLALSLCGLGECAYRARSYDVAIRHYASAIEAIEAHPHRLGIGYCMVKARLGLARAFHRLHMRREGAEQFARADRLFTERQRYDFHWTWEGSDAQALFDFAVYYAVHQQWDEAAKALDGAVHAGWGDLPSLEFEPAFARYRDEPAFAAVCTRVLERGTLPGANRGGI
jgi:serine/threonine-protein kinase